MKNLDTLQLENQTREFATLTHNATGLKQDNKLFFVQIDNTHAVDNLGAIFQIFDGTIEDLEEMQDEDFNILLAYVSEDGTVYNYAEDSADFEDDSEELEIFSNCQQQAELNYDNQ